MGDVGPNIVGVQSKLMPVKIAQAQPKILPRRSHRERVTTIILSKQPVATTTCPSNTQAATIKWFAHPCTNMLSIVKPAASIRVNSTIKRGVQITVLEVDIAGVSTGAKPGN